MTAIAGILSNDTSRADGRKQQENLLARIEPRGSRGVDFWHDEGILLVHAQSRSGARTAVLSGSEHGLRITGHMRIDNRKDILARLGLSPGDIGSDADVVAHAFRRWGTSSFEMLIGDFAFALWDQAERTLYCCRDHFGVRPLFYETSEQGFAFASEAKMLPGFVQGTISAEHISNFLASIRTYTSQTERTGIFRLMPGHWLSYREGVLRTQAYWQLEIEPHHPTDPVAEFRSLFEQAVADRMDDPSNTAAMLSGGLDSTAIAGVAERILDANGASSGLRTYSIIYEDSPALDERKYINDLLSTGHYAHRFLAMDGYKPLQGAADMLSLLEGPYHAIGLRKSSLLYHTAADEGIEVLLSGDGGDEVIGYGTGRIWEMAQAGHWLRVIPLIRTLSRLTASSDFRIYHNLLERFGSGHLHTRAARWALRPLVRNMYGTTTADPPAWQTYLSSEYIEAMDLHERDRKATFMTTEQRTNDQHYQLFGLRSDLTGPAFESLDKASSAVGLEMRFPFFDLRLVKFCLGLPSSEKLRPNETRSILKRGLKDIYPPSIRKRQDKTDFMAEISVGMAKHHGDLLDEIARDSHGHMAPFMNMDKLRAGLENYRRSPLEADPADVQFFWCVAMLFIWLTSHQQSGAWPG